MANAFLPDAFNRCGQNPQSVRMKSKLAVMTLAMLLATLLTFPEATVARSEPLAMEVVFTTPVGFRDQVDFRIDPQALRVDFRSRFSRSSHAAPCQPMTPAMSRPM